MTPTLSVVVPAYDEGAVLPELFKRLLPVMRAVEGGAELVVVDDGSGDGQTEWLRAQVEQIPELRVVVLSRNFGHAMALSAGLAEARGRAVAMLDADLQDPPELLPTFLERWSEGVEVVYGVRRNRRESLVLRMAYATFYRFLRRTASVELPLDAGDFCLLDRRVVDLLVGLPERTRYLRGLRSWAGFRQEGVPYDREARAGGRSHYGWGRLVELGLDGILSFSSHPLRLASLAGLATTAVAMTGLVFYLVWWLLGFELVGRRPQDVPGFMSLAVMILFFAGVQLAFLGVLGEYVGRIYREVKSRPGWVVKERWPQE